MSCSWECHLPWECMPLAFGGQNLHPWAHEQSMCSRECGHRLWSTQRSHPGTREPGEMMGGSEVLPWTSPLPPAPSLTAKVRSISFHNSNGFQTSVHIISLGVIIQNSRRSPGDSDFDSQGVKESRSKTSEVSGLRRDCACCMKSAGDGALGAWMPALAWPPLSPFTSLFLKFQLPK